MEKVKKIWRNIDWIYYIFVIILSFNLWILSLEIGGKYVSEILISIYLPTIFIVVPILFGFFCYRIFCLIKHLLKKNKKEALRNFGIICFDLVGSVFLLTLQGVLLY